MLIRPAYPVNFTIGLLLLIFFISGFISFEVFEIKWKEVVAGDTALLAMVIAGVVGVIFVLILWEEFLFPVKVRPIEDEIIFRNHFTKLKTQVAIYSLIPAAIVFLYLTFEVRIVQFSIWSFVCTVAPLRKLISGIKNYNDFLKLTDDTIEFKNNEHEGVLLVKEIEGIDCVSDEQQTLHKLKVLLKGGRQVTIDLDEMELGDYYNTIDQFVQKHYPSLVINK